MAQKPRKSGLMNFFEGSMWKRKSRHKRSSSETDLSGTGNDSSKDAELPPALSKKERKSLRKKKGKSLHESELAKLMYKENSKSLDYDPRRCESLGEIPQELSSKSNHQDNHASQALKAHQRHQSFDSACTEYSQNAPRESRMRTTSFKEGRARKTKSAYEPDTVKDFEELLAYTSSSKVKRVPELQKFLSQSMTEIDERREYKGCDRVLSPLVEDVCLDLSAQSGAKSLSCDNLNHHHGNSANNQRNGEPRTQAWVFQVPTESGPNAIQGQGTNSGDINDQATVDDTLNGKVDAIMESNPDSFCPRRSPSLFERSGSVEGSVRGYTHSDYVSEITVYDKCNRQVCKLVSPQIVIPRPRDNGSVPHLMRHSSFDQHRPLPSTLQESRSCPDMKISNDDCLGPNFLDMKDHNSRIRSRSSGESDYYMKKESSVNEQDVSQDAGSYVALTVLGKSPGGSGSQTPKGGTEIAPHLLQQPKSPSERVTAPTAASTEMETQMLQQKITTLRMMYDNTAREYEEIKSQLARNPDHIQLNQDLQEKIKVLENVEKQLYKITGIHAETSHQQVTSPTPRAPNAPAPIRRHGSGDQLHQTKEDMNTNQNQQDTALFVPPITPTPTPWDDEEMSSMLVGGSKHKKSDSMPETVYEMDEAAVTNCSKIDRSITVGRSHSDSRKEGPEFKPIKEGASAEEIEKLRGDINLRRRMMMKKASSLPSNVGEAGNLSDHSPTQSPTPPGCKEAWGEGATSDTNDEMASVSMQGQLAPDPNRLSASPSPQQHGPSSLGPDIISMEEDEFSTDEEHHRRMVNGYHNKSGPMPHKLEDHGPFHDLNALKYQPAHLAVFLHYVFSNHEPSPLLFYLVTDSYAMCNGTLKELKKWAFEIYSTFLVEKSPLYVNVEDKMTTLNIDHVLAPKCEREDAIKSVFHPARHYAQDLISDLLADFRAKRALGLGSIYGDHELQDSNVDRQKIVETYLLPHFERLSNAEDDKSVAMAAALATVLKQMLMSPTSGSFTKVERTHSFVTKEKKQFKIYKSNRRSIQVKNHQFQPYQSNQLTMCHLCCTYLWGVGIQGYQCTNCENLYHKSCIDKLQDNCSRKKKDQRKSMLDRIRPIARKPSNNSGPAIREAQRLQDENFSSPTGLPPISQGSRMITRDEEEHEESVLEAQKMLEEKENRDRQSISGPTPKKQSRNSASSSKSNLSRNSTFFASIPGEDEQEPDFGKGRARARATGRMRSSKSADYPPELGPTTPNDGVQPSRDSSPERTAEIEESKKGINLNRSESLKTKQQGRTKHVRRTRSDVQVDEQTIKALNKSGSSSNSSLSNRSVETESPSNSNEVLSDNTSSFGQSVLHPSSSNNSVNANDPYAADSDMEVERELPPLSHFISKDILKKMNSKDKKKQEVLNEMLYTEKAHVRNLKLLDKVFYRPMLRDPLIPMELKQLLFPNLEQMIYQHSQLNNQLKTARKKNGEIGDIADILLDRFDGKNGISLESACLEYCRRQPQALEALRQRLKKDPKFQAWMQERSNDPSLRRLELKDFLPMEMQRLVKYPLLLASILKHTPANTPEHEKLQRCENFSKRLLSNVNQAVMECENEQKLIDFQKRLDKRAIQNNQALKDYKDLDLTKRKLIYDGPLKWRLNKSKNIDLHVLLLEDLLVLLQKQDDKLVLKCQCNALVPGKDDTKFTHVPIISLRTLLTKNVANDRRGFFLVSTSEAGPQIYELVTAGTDDKSKWIRYITNATTAAQNSKDSSVPKKQQPTSIAKSTAPAVRQEPPKEPENVLRKVSSGSIEEESPSIVVDGLATDKAQKEVERVTKETSIETLVDDQAQGDSSFEGVEESAQELLKRKSEEIRQGLEEQHRLVAHILNVPLEDFDHIAEIAGEDAEEEKESKELLLASICQADLLTSLVNEKLALSAEEGSKTEGAMESEATLRDKEQPCVSLPSRKVLSITEKLSKQLNKLLEVVQKQEKEKEELQQELRLIKKQTSIDSQPSTSHSRPQSFISVASSTDENADPGTSASANEDSSTPDTPSSSGSTVVAEHQVETPPPTSKEDEGEFSDTVTDNNTDANSNLRTSCDTASDTVIGVNV